MGLGDLLGRPRLHAARMKEPVAGVRVIHGEKAARGAIRAQGQREVVDGVVVHPSLTHLVGDRVARVLAEVRAIPDRAPQASRTSAPGPPLPSKAESPGGHVITAVTAQNTKTGFPLLRPEAVEDLGETLLSLATLVTPNVHEAQALTRIQVRTLAEAEEAAETLWFCVT